MTGDEDLERARTEIARLLLEQCSQGRQTTSLPSEMAACGQFIGGDAARRSQRGAHGTAAALTVLGTLHSVQSTALVCRVLKYMEREWLESNSMDEPNHDKTNVIKIAETLLAVLKIPPGVASTENLARNLAERLKKSKKNGPGWAYFTDGSDGVIDELPTAFALRALAAYGSDDLVPIAEYLLKRVTDAAGSLAVENNSDIYVHTFSLFVLSHSDIRGLSAPVSDYKKAFSAIWNRLSAIRENVEQNLEYWKDENKSFYVRVPWQLYLLALAAKLGSKRVLTNVATEARITSLVTEVNSKKGFRYPHSGDVPSSRTNAILYEILGLVKMARQQSQWLPALRALNAMGEAMNSRIATWAVSVVAAAVIGYSIYAWVMDPTKTIGDLAGEFLSVILLALLHRRNA